MRRTILSAAIAAVVLGASVAGAAVTAAHKCEGGKNDASGKYAACMAKAEKSLVQGSTLESYDTAQLKCAEKYSRTWAKLEGGGSCTTTGDDSSIQGFLDACVLSVADALGGGTLPPDVVTCDADLTTCDGELTTCDGDLAVCDGSLSTCSGSLATCDADLTTCDGELTTCDGDLTVCDGSLSTCSGSLATCNAGNAAAANVLSGKTFSSSAGLGVAGTMTNVGQQNVTPGVSPVTITQGYHGGSGAVAGDADLVAANVALGANIFGVSGTAAPGSQPLETGQTTCYNTAGTGIPCTFTGQDGDLQLGAVHSFTDNGNGTITDNKTGLMWEKQSDDGTIHDKDNLYTWANAFASKVATLNSTVFAGHNDWRVPNRFELETLLNLGAAIPTTYTAFTTACAAACTVLTCSCTRSDDYWSSSTYQGFPSFAWYVSFYDGNTNYYEKTNSIGVRAVRAGS